MALGLPMVVGMADLPLHKLTFCAGPAEFVLESE
jgi:hypothetical protein